MQLLLVEDSADKQLARRQEVEEVVWQLDKAEEDTVENVEAVVVAYSHRVVVDSKVGKSDLEVEVLVDMHNAVPVDVSRNHSCFQTPALKLN